MALNENDPRSNGPTPEEGTEVPHERNLLGELYFGEHSLDDEDGSLPPKENETPPTQETE
ncbi:hypothetical protein ACFLZP_04825 [Patescibacteria group bacterium]